MTVLEKAKAKLDAAQRGMSYRLPGYDKSDLQWWTAYIEGAEDQKREDAAAIEELQAAQPHWVSVKERLPEHGQHILICLRFTCIDGTEEPARTVYGHFSNYENRGRRYWTWEDEEVQCQCCMSGEEEEPDEEYGAFRITHWMPLPEPPKEEADGSK